MKATQQFSDSNTNFLINLLEAKNLVEEKVRINLYLSKAVVRVIDSLTNNRSALVEDLVISRAKSLQKLPYGMLKSKTSQKQIKDITIGWAKSIDELQD